MNTQQTLEDQYADMVTELAKSGEVIRNQMTPNDAHMLHMVVGICGEAGELTDAIKKAVIYRKVLDRANVIEELGDIEFYLEGLRQALQITRTETLEDNFDKLKNKRYKNGYTDAAAINRDDKLLESKHSGEPIFGDVPGATA